jgi:hypothetical protein
MNGSGKDKFGGYMDHQDSFSATVHPSYFIRMATDKQAQAVQETTILRSRYYTKASMKTHWYLKNQFPI